MTQPSKQSEWERVSASTKRAQLQASWAGKKSRGYFTETPTGTTVLKQQVQHTADALLTLTETRTRGMGGKYTSILRQVAGQDYERLAYIGLSTVLDALFSTRKRASYVSSVVQQLGTRMEHEHQLVLFERDNAGTLYTIRHEIDQTTYKGKVHKAIQRMNRLWAGSGQEWGDWGAVVRAQIGTRVLKCVLDTMEEYIKVKQFTVGTTKEFKLISSPEFDTFMEEHMEYFLGNSRVSIPCVEAPVPWKQSPLGIHGGYHTLEVSTAHPFIKTRLPEQDQYISEHPPMEHIRAVNALQAVEWEINTDVLKLITTGIKSGKAPDIIPPLEKLEYPPRPPDGTPDRISWGLEAHQLYKINKKNTHRLMKMRSTIAMAVALQGQPLWFVWTCCFRGRMYPSSSTVSPQGSDYSKALLRFRKGKPLGTLGYLWLGTHGANTYGVRGKSNLDKYRWAVDNSERLQQVAREPFSSTGREMLSGASNPFAFYAFCCEWNGATLSGDPCNYVSHLPIAQDGSANGYQHYSALLRDDRGAAQVNLTDTELPSDIYDEVSRELSTRLTQYPGAPVPQDFIAGISRSFVKGPVLSMPYGVTVRGVSLMLEEYINQHPEQFNMNAFSLRNWDAITVCTDVLIKVVNDLLPRAQELQQWFKTVAELAANQSKHVHWVSPVGFPVMQPYRRGTVLKFRSALLGDRTLYLRDKEGGIDRAKEKVGLSPNFIHSMDASHLVITMNLSPSMTMSCAHDEYSTHACDVDLLGANTRVAFFELYDRDWLRYYKSHIQEYTAPLPYLPEYGTWNPRTILKAEYFFG